MERRGFPLSLAVPGLMASAPRSAGLSGAGVGESRSELRATPLAWQRGRLLPVPSSWKGSEGGWLGSCSASEAGALNPELLGELLLPFRRFLLSCLAAGAAAWRFFVASGVGRGVGF